jgi:hypothetical protein
MPKSRRTRREGSADGRVRARVGVGPGSASAIRGRPGRPLDDRAGRTSGDDGYRLASRRSAAPAANGAARTPRRFGAVAVETHSGHAVRPRVDDGRDRPGDGEDARRDGDRQGRPHRRRRGLDGAGPRDGDRQGRLHRGRRRLGADGARPLRRRRDPCGRSGSRSGGRRTVARSRLAGSLRIGCGGGRGFRRIGSRDGAAGDRGGLTGRAAFRLGRRRGGLRRARGGHTVRRGCRAGRRLLRVPRVGARGALARVIARSHYVAGRRRLRIGDRLRVRARVRLHSRRCRRRRRFRRLLRPGARRFPRRQEPERVDVALWIVDCTDPEVDIRDVELGFPARPDTADRISLGHRGAAPHRDRAEMDERDRPPVGGADRERQAARRHGAREAHDAGRGRENRRAARAPDVDAPMLSCRVWMPPVEREAAQHRPVGWPGPRPRTRDEHENESERDEQHHTTHETPTLLSD